MGVNSSQIHAVPHSAIQSVLRNKKAASATGRVKSPINKSTPRDFRYALYWTSNVSVVRHQSHNTFQQLGAWPFSM